MADVWSIAGHPRSPALDGIFGERGRALCKVELICSERVLFAATLDPASLPFVVERPQHLYAGDPFGVRLQRNHQTTPGSLRWKLGSVVIWTSSFAETERDTTRDLSPSQSEQTPYQPWLYNELGDSQLVLEHQEASDAPFVTWFMLPLQVTPRASVYRDFVALLEDINQVHAGLVQDVMGRAWIKPGLLGEAVTRLQPAAFVSYLDTLIERLTRAIQRIARQPSTRLSHALAIVRYRGGDPIDRTGIASLARSRETQMNAQGQICQIGKVRTRRPTLTSDLPEHRHIAAQLKRLARKAHELARHCEQTATLLGEEEVRWGRASGPSVFEQVHLPRINAYRELAEHAKKAAMRLRVLNERHSFLAEAAPPRTTFGPTPVFLNRASYREVYRLLCEARNKFGILLDEDAVRLHYKDFPTLYEMWCFLRVVAYLNERLGTPIPDPPFAFDEDIYHPSIRPGQRFRYRISRNIHVEVCYEAEFAPWRQAQRNRQPYGAAFTSEPLRPDITLTVDYFDEPQVMLVLDAKSTDSFHFSRFREMTDYSKQIVELATGRQPVKQVFLLHRDRSRTSLANMTNIPHYLKGREVPFHSIILGAIPVVPSDTSDMALLLGQVIDLFLAIYADLPQPAKGMATPHADAKY